MLALTEPGTMGPVTDSDSDNVRARRNRLGISMKALAAEAGVSENTLRRVEKGTGEAHRRGVILAALERLEGGQPPQSVDSGGRNLRAVDVQLPSDQSVLSAEVLYDVSDDDFTAMIVYSAKDGTSTEKIRAQLEEIHRRLSRNRR